MAFLALPLHAGYAAPLPDYKCKIESVYGSASGTPTVLEYLRKSKVGREFTVDRPSGKMIGALKNSFATEPVVIDFGTDGNAYKAVTTMTIEQGLGAGSSIYALVVNEYDERAKKPFVFLDGDTVYFGACIYFH